MHAKSAIIIVVDRLSASFLSPYGNTWIETPELNRLASESSLFEFALSNSPLLTNTYDSYWLGSPDPPSQQLDDSLPAQLASLGVDSLLVSDDEVVVEHPAASRFARTEIIEHPRAATAEDVTQTRLARLFAAGGVEVLAGLDSPFLLWLHAGSLAAAWDAPYEFREQFADEDDPPPPDLVIPPSLTLPTNYDPDELWGYARAYAGQLLALDACCGALLEALKDSEHAESTLLVLTSPRGFPMGEHLRVGASQPALYSELLHVPLLIRHPQLDGATIRRQALVQPSDLMPTLLSWYGIDAADQSLDGCDLLADFHDPDDSIRTHVTARAADEIAIRTPQWFYRRAGDGASELYVKPDDRYEANEVAARCSDVMTEFEQLAAAEESPGKDPS